MSFSRCDDPGTARCDGPGSAGPSSSSGLAVQEPASRKDATILRSVVAWLPTRSRFVLSDCTSGSRTRLRCFFVLCTTQVRSTFRNAENLQSRLHSTRDLLFAFVSDALSKDVHSPCLECWSIQAQCHCRLQQPKCQKCSSEEATQVCRLRECRRCAVRVGFCFGQSRSAALQLQHFHTSPGFGFCGGTG